MKLIAKRLQILSSAASITVLFISMLFPSLLGATVHAFPVGGQVTSRKITLSSSAQGPTGNGTGVSYEVSFNLATAHANLRGIVVDFCAGSPIVGFATCAAPTGFNIPTSPTVTLGAGISGGTWVSGATSPNNRTLKISDSTGNNLAANANVRFTISGVTNPSTLGTFYARIITYNAQGAGTDFANYAPGTEGSTTAIDYGGVALSTANQLTVTAKIQESLTFCVYTSGTTCGASPTGTSVALGDSNGVLASFSTNYTNTAKFNVASNAQGGVVVNLKGENLCRVANPCTNTDTGNIIDRSGDSCTADVATTSVEQFGVRVSVLGSGVSSTNYNCGASSHRFNRTNTTTTYGDTIANTTGPSDEVATTLEFMAKASTTTQAGIYTTVLGLIATGTY